MDKIFNIKYIDAHYSYEPDLYTKEYYLRKEDLKKQSTALHFFSTHGFVEKHNNNIVVAFVKENGVSIKETIEKGEKIIDGLVIPDTALLSRVDASDSNILKGVKIGSRVAVTWRDIVRVVSQSRYDCSIMYTEGTLYKKESDHIVLKDTETIRTHPMPAKNHPAGKPLWYTIPISFIKDIEVTS